MLLSVTDDFILQIMEYYFDLSLYYKVGYGNAMVGPSTCPITQNLFKKLMWVKLSMTDEDDESFLSLLSINRPVSG